MTIACGTDLSPQAAQAADAAAAIAVALGTPLDLVYVADGFWRELPERARGPLVDEVRDRLRAEAELLAAISRDHLPTVLLVIACLSLTLMAILSRARRSPGPVLIESVLIAVAYVLGAWLLLRTGS